jgi:antitoxin component of MazEF toxin-antitoxin module
LLKPSSGYLDNLTHLNSSSVKPSLDNEQALILETPVRHNMVDLLEKTERDYLNKTRRLVETVIGQLTGQFNMNKVWARKCGHYPVD